jgi:hypothetical protein
MEKAMKKLLLLTIAFSFSSAVTADELMSEAQFVDYSARQHCINQDLWDQPDKQNEQLFALEKEFGITDENFDAVDALIMDYQQDSQLRGQVEAKVKTLCPE